MKLTRLRLLGFKSFVEPTDFLIEPGLTGVVGPNGCGKSNLVEALRWVMGETSHKSLRAVDMDDVIFSGTNSRPGRNNAEVAIQIDNKDAQGAGSVQRARDARRVAPDRARGGLHLPHQRPRGARPRRAYSLRRCLDRLALARAGASGPHRRDHPGQARAAPAGARGGGRNFGPARAAARGRAAPARRRAEPVAARGCDRAARRPDGRPQEAGTASDPLPRRRPAGAQGRGHAVPPALGRRQCRACRGRAGQERGGSPGCRAHRRAGRSLHTPGQCIGRAAGLARGRGARRRSLATTGDGPRDARARGGPRQGAHGRARPQTCSARGRHRARAAPCRRRGSRACKARRRGSRAAARDHSQRRAARRRRPARRGSRRSARGLGKSR